jgi:hypothetical protein
MKALLRILGVVISFAVVLLVISTVYVTATGRLTWYFRVNGVVSIDGQTTSGYMHANTQRTILLITRTDGKRPETYLVSVGDGKPISDCGDWRPIRFFPFPVGDVNPPCLLPPVDPAKVLDAPLPKTMLHDRRSIEFSTASGRRVKAEW